MHFLPSLLLLGTAAAGPLLTRQSSPGPITLLSATASGPGCPPNSTTVHVGAEGQELTIAFDAWAAEVGPNASASLREVSCDIIVRASVPLGCTVASMQTVYHGFGQLDAGVTGTFAAQYSVSPGQITSGSNPPNAVITSAAFGGSGNTYTKTDPWAVRFNPGTPNNQQVAITVRSRVYLQGNQGLLGFLSADDATVSIVSQGAC
ncbi:hypothetical protein B0T18DRAFT_207652 [Schizothecium vesticola]|uniref:Secreted protein n=1 Tax=Schizothecium vesticola TaxID=314040 RepID=A0AA40JYT9_9PEZI|nr:hypothetical protein B0T18DRAFT_207652 [Schizothecium vesticola]